MVRRRARIINGCAVLSLSAFFLGFAANGVGNAVADNSYGIRSKPSHDLSALAHSR